MSQQDLDGDQLPDVTIIETAFATQHDRVYVHDRDQDMRGGSRWQDMTDFEDDIWIFDAGADGSAQLIVAFAVEDGNQVAYFFADENGDTQVSYRLVAQEVNITESPFWRLKVAARGNWLLPDGRQNPDIRISVDGTITRSLIRTWASRRAGGPIGIWRRTGR